MSNRNGIVVAILAAHCEQVVRIAREFAVCDGVSLELTESEASCKWKASARVQSLTGVLELGYRKATTPLLE